MKHLKLLALAAVATGALMASIGVGTASATVLCSTTADPCPKTQNWPVGTVLDFSIPEGGTVRRATTSGSAFATCSFSTMKGKISRTGSTTETVTIPIEELTWGNGISVCTTPTHTIKLGNLEVHRIAGTSNGTVTADGAFEWTESGFSGSCVYKVENGASIGVIMEGNPPSFVVNAVAQGSGTTLCPPSSLWLAEYILTTPEKTTLSVSDSTA